jgi:tetratricopeptide (TPR) repeat protein
MVWGSTQETPAVRDTQASDSTNLRLEADELTVPKVSDQADSAEVQDRIRQVLKLGESTLRESLLDDAKTYFEKRVDGPDAAENRCELARVHFGLSVMHKLRGEKKQGRAELEEALAWAKKSVEEDPSRAKTHALLADLWGERIVGYGGLMVGARFGPRVKNENSKAVSLAPNDPEVVAALGRQYLLSPKTFGGDPDKAIELFEKSLTLRPDSDVTCVWLARAFKKKKDREGFQKAIAVALKLQPENAQAKWELSKWSGESQ